MSRVRVGIAVAGEMLAGSVEVRGGLEEPVLDRSSAGESLSATIARMLNVLVDRGSRAEVSVAFLDDRCCASPLFGVAPETDHGTVSRELADLPTAFFLGRTGSLRAGNVWHHNGAWHGVVVDRDAAAAVQSAVKESGARLVGILTLDATTDLVAATAIAVAARSEDVGVVDLEREERERRRVARMRSSLGVVIVLMLTWSLLAPLLSLRAVLSGHERHLAAMLAERDSLASQLRSHAGSASEILRIAELGADRDQVRSVLRALANALPDSAAIVTLRLDMRSGSAAVISADAASAVARLAVQAEFPTLRIAGAITSEGGEQAHLERVNLVWGTQARASARIGRRF